MINDCGCLDPVGTTIVTPGEVVTLIPCIGTTCDEVYDAKCVQYNGINLPNINVLNKDRLDAILRKLNFDVNSQAIVVINSNSVKLTGTGLLSNPIKAETKLDPDLANLLTVGENGMLTKFTVNNVITLIQLIKNTPVLQSLFCDLYTACRTDSCGLSTSMAATMN